MITRITMMLVLATACAANTGCLSMRGYGPFGDSFQSGCASCASSGIPEASCSAPDASCGLPEASCSAPDASCDLLEASCSAPDASCGLPTDSCDTCTTSVGCGSPVVGRGRFWQRICDALWGRSSYYSDGYSSEAYWSEWHNDPPYNSQVSTPHAGAGDGGQYYSSAPRRRSRRSKQDVNFGDELRFARRDSGTSQR